MCDEYPFFSSVYFSSFLIISFLEQILCIRRTSALFYIYGFENCHQSVDTVLCVMFSDKVMLLVGILHV